MRGLFIAVEGIDGCGKSTFVAGLAAALRKRGGDVAVTAEPTATWLGEAVRRSWKARSGPVVEAHLFMADRAAHCAEIARHMDRGRTVVCDRYHDSTLAYQGSALAKSFPGGLKGSLAWLDGLAPPGMLRPDVTFFLKIAPEAAMARMSGRAALTKFERLSYLRGVHAAYLELEKSGRFRTLEASYAPGVLVARAIKVLEKEVPKRAGREAAPSSAGRAKRGRPARTNPR